MSLKTLNILFGIVISNHVYAGSFASVVQLVKSLNNESSAVAITTKQTSLSANQISASYLASAQQFATAASSIAMSRNVVDAIVSTDPQVGQPNTIKCVAQQQGGLHVEAESQRDKDRGHLMRTFSSSRVTSQANANKQVLSAHRAHYCTASEAKQGMCEMAPNGMQGWDSNYAGAFNEATLSPEAELAGYAYVAMVSDFRAGEKTDCMDVACNAAQANQIGLSAISSMSANSLVDQITDRRQPVITGK